VSTLSSSGLARNLKRGLKSISFRSFLLLDRVGVHVLPKHYYTPLPDYAWLRANENLWLKRSNLAGLDWNLDDQMRWLEETCRPYYAEVQGLGHYREIVAQKLGPGYGPIESLVLHCVIRTYKPRTIVEIGSGVSTACMLHAVEANGQSGEAAARVVCVEPFPREAFRHVSAVTHIEAPCQAVDVDVFLSLRAGDVLFIDSSHAVKVGSDVVRIYLEILPRLRPGVLVHIHDVYFPYLYSRHVLDTYFGWQETVLVQALLVNNPRLRVLAALSALHYDRRQRLQALLKDYRPQPDREGLPAKPAVAMARGTRALDRGAGHFPCSLWLLTA
jgi:predicted O-methyltransferase YrrM